MSPASSATGKAEDSYGRFVLTFAVAFGLAAIAAGLYTFVVAAELLLDKRESTLIDSENGADALAWGLAFLMAGLSVISGLISLSALGRLTSKTQDKKSTERNYDEVLDEVAKWMRGAEILSQGVEKIGSHPFVVKASLLEKARSLKNDAAMACERSSKAVGDLRARLAADDPEKIIGPLNDLVAKLDALKGSPAAPGIGEAVGMAATIENKPKVEKLIREAVAQARRDLDGAKRDLLASGDVERAIIALEPKERM